MDYILDGLYYIGLFLIIFGALSPLVALVCYLGDVFKKVGYKTGLVKKPKRKWMRRKK